MSYKRDTCPHCGNKIELIRAGDILEKYFCNACNLRIVIIGGETLAIRKIAPKRQDLTL